MKKDIGNIYVRKLEKEDWADFRSLRIEAVKENPHYYLDSPSNAEARSSDHWIRSIENPEGSIFGLFDEAEIIGLAAAFRMAGEFSDAVKFTMGYIRPAYRGLGLSVLLYDARFDWARAQEGIVRVIVSHREGNEASRAANRKFGFLPYDSGEIVYGDGSRGIDIRYELRL